MTTGKPIKNFRDLDAWQESHKLAIMLYRATKSFPKEEMFGLTNQMRRAAVSVTSNIAEGFSRQGFKEKIQFYFIAKGSLNELKSQSILAHDIGYLINDFIAIIEQAELADKILQGLIIKSKSYL